MSSYTINLRKGPQKKGPVSRWWLDFPNNPKIVTLTELTAAPLLFQGWVLQKQLSELNLYFKQGDAVSIYSLDIERPDVIEIILQEASETHSQRRCGFKFSVLLIAAEFELGVKHNTTFYPLVKGSVDGPFNVLQGEAPWLFLDNDTNKSVDQYTGKLLLTKSKMREWQCYLNDLGLLSPKKSKPAMLTAPSKEQVYPQFYPYTKAKVTPFDQLLNLDVKQLIIDPVELLANSEHRTFRYTDTHWASIGACLASLVVAERFGLPVQQARAVFADDKYTVIKAFGDLGNKVFPPIAVAEELLIGFSYHSKLIYNNQLPNFGRVMLIENNDALVQGHLLLFGSSSAYSMLNYLTRLFSELTFIHTAGNVDVTVFEALQPDYLLTQTNARFVVRAPTVKYLLRDLLSEKLNTPNVDADKLLKESKQQAVANASRRVAFFHQLLISASGD